MPWQIFPGVIIISYSFAVSGSKLRYVTPRTPSVHPPAISLRSSLLRGGATTGPPLSAASLPIVSSETSGSDLPVKKLPEFPTRSRLRLYLNCFAIVFLWAAVGTLFYSWINAWPLPQSFFYAIDAGMSIGFCTDVKETTDASRAFTVLYVLAFSSVIGGALTVFVEDVAEGIAAASRGAYVRLVEEDAFRKADASGSGTLNYEEFRFLPALDAAGLGEEEMRRVWGRFDTLRDGAVRMNGKFVRRYRRIDRIIRQATGKGAEVPSFPGARVNSFLHEKIWSLGRSEHRIYFWFGLWLVLGVVWGVTDQKWTVVTALHFAVSACTTGGLTAPPVGADGILPTGASLFCGFYCLFGVPLFAVTLGHFARVLVREHVVAMESKVIARPMSRTEFEFAQKLCTDDNVVHLSDFIIFQLLRQGKISIEMVQALKNRFKAMDVDNTGWLTLVQATSNSN